VEANSQSREARIWSNLTHRVVRLLFSIDQSGYSTFPGLISVEKPRHLDNCTRKYVSSFYQDSYNLVNYFGAKLCTHSAVTVISLTSYMFPYLICAQHPARGSLLVRLSDPSCSYLVIIAPLIRCSPSHGTTDDVTTMGAGGCSTSFLGPSVESRSLPRSRSRSRQSDLDIGITKVTAHA
jgi:hypothetical protein